MFIELPVVFCKNIDEYEEGQRLGHSVDIIEEIDLTMINVDQIQAVNRSEFDGRTMIKTSSEALLIDLPYKEVKGIMIRIDREELLRKLN